MAEDLKTLREVSIAITGIKERLGDMAKVFYGACALSLAAFGGLFYMTYSNGQALGGLNGQLGEVNGRLGAFTDTAGGQLKNIETLLEQRSDVQTIPGPALATLEGWRGVSVRSLKALAGHEDKLPRELSVPAWIFVRDLKAFEALEHIKRLESGSQQD